MLKLNNSPVHGPLKRSTHLHALIERDDWAAHDVGDRYQIQAVLGDGLRGQEGHTLDLQKPVVQRVRERIRHPLGLRLQNG